MHVTAQTKSIETFMLIVKIRMVDQGMAFCDSAKLCKIAPAMLLLSKAPTLGTTQCLPGLLPQQSGQCVKLTTHFHLQPKLKMNGAIPPYTIAIYQAHETGTHSRTLTCDGNASVAKIQHRLDIIHYPCNKFARLYVLPTNCIS